MIKKTSILFLVMTLLLAGVPMSVFANGTQTSALETETIEYQEPIKEELPKPNISRDEALAIAKKSLKDLFDISVDDSKFNFNIENRKDWSEPELYTWQISWQYQDAAEYIYINIALDSMTGEILSINKENRNYEDPIKRQAKFTKEEAREKAEAFINKIIPELLDQTVIRDNVDDNYRIMPTGMQSVYYNFNYIRLYDGIKYENNYINVSMDGATGEIRNFNYRWNDLKDLPSKDEIISKEEATKIIKDNLKMELIYLPIRDQYKYEPVPKRVKLAYRANYNYDSKILNARTGEILDYNGRVKSKNVKSTNITDKQLQDILKEASPVTKKKEMTKDRAKELALLILKEEIKGNIKINNISYIEGDGHWEAVGKKAWNIDFSVEEVQNNEQNKEAMPRQNGRIMFDALTEELLAFSNWDYYGPNNVEEPVISWEEAYQKSIDMIAKYHPNKIDDIKTEQVYYYYNDYIDGKEVSPMNYSFNFTRKVDNVLYEENSINIGINSRTGKIQNFSCRWQEDMTFPEVEEVITEEQAKNTLFQYNGVELAYNRYNKTNNYQNPQYEIKLVYRLNPKKVQYSSNMLLEATSGKPIDYNGNEIADYDLKAFEESLKGHWVQRNAKLLASQGILEIDGFNPEKAINKIDVVKMLVKARGMDNYYPMEKAQNDSKTEFSDVSEDSEDYRYIQTAIRYGIIDNKDGAFNGSKELTREELAVLVVKTLEYSTLAKATEIFTLDYKDKSSISEELKGYVAISKGLNLFRESNKFRPKDQATMAETANMVYKSLEFMNR